MANCLITKLKANVIDDALYKVNTMTLRVQESGIPAYRMVTINTLKTNSVHLVKGNLYSDESGTNIVAAEGSYITSTSSNVYFGINEETIIEFEDYHAITTITLQSPSATINGKAINIEDFGFNSALVLLYFRFVTATSGSVEKLAERLFAVRDFASVTHNTCSIDARNNAITFNGQVASKQLSIKIIVDSLTIHEGLGGTGATLATYNEGTKTWTYA